MDTEQGRHLKLEIKFLEERQSGTHKYKENIFSKIKIYCVLRHSSAQYVPCLSHDVLGGLNERFKKIPELN